MSIIKRSDKKKGCFVSLATAKHNAKIVRISYANKKITKPLLWVGLVIPDFKISWAILVCYLVYVYPIKFRVILRNKLIYSREEFLMCFSKFVMRFKRK
jgi:hypothetical protein